MAGRWSELFEDGFGVSGAEREQMRTMARKYVAGAEEVQDRLSGLVGRAESEDGRIRVAFSNENAVEELHIDPRALRDGSEVLAENIRTVIADARADLLRQVDEVVTAAYPERPDPEQLVSDADELYGQLSDLNDLIRRSGDRIGEAFERFQQQLEEGLRARLHTEPPTDD